MTYNNYLKHITQCFPRLPKYISTPFQKLWNEGRIHYKKDNGVLDEIDLLSSQLVCTALAKQDKLLVILPNKASHRPTILFTTALMMYGVERINKSQSSGNIIYFGSETGIREQLGNVSVNNICLDTVFYQHRLTRQGNQITEKRTNSIPSQYLPKVICIYSPADPISILKQHTPDWIAIDCSDKSTLHWLTPLLSYINLNKIPMIAWVQNALSNSVEEFKSVGMNIYHWPYRPIDYNDNSVTFDDINVTQIIPLLIKGESAEIVANPLKNAYRLLSHAITLENGRLSRDALKVGWSCLRYIECLSVPFDLYEAEACHHWGLSRIIHLYEGVEHFVKDLQPINQYMFETLKKALVHLEAAINYLRNYKSPIWEALISLCIYDVPKDSIRVIVFTSSARKQIFTFALLAKYNINEADLRELNIQLASIKEISKCGLDNYLEEIHSVNSQGATFKQNIKKEIIIVGLPSPILSSHLEPILRMGQVKILIYEYQIPAFKKQVEKWRKSMNVNIHENIKTLSHLGGIVKYANTSEQIECIRLSEQSTVNAKQKSSINFPQDSVASIWEAADPIHEVSWLLSQDEVLEENMFNISDLKYDDEGDNFKDTPREDQKLWVNNAIEIIFDENLYSYFSPEEIINVILKGRNGEYIEKRYISALRPNDRILFIQGQRRQNLYDLIISRVHQHPSIELHMAFVRRWHEDLVNFYREWKMNNNSGVEDLLVQIQKLGSNIGSTTTLRQWLKGTTLCPDKKEDILVIAEVLGMEFVKKNYLRIYKAAKRLYGLHIGLARRLSKWLNQQAAGVYSGENIDIFDEELGLSIQDFKDSLLILHVKNIEKKLGLFSVSSLGVLERRN